ADLLSGGAGDDSLYGNDGADTLAGGAGSDRFVFMYQEYDQIVPDIVADFQAGNSGDSIDLTDIHGKNIAAGYTQWPAQQLPYTHGYIRLVQEGKDLLVGYDRDGFNPNYSFKSIARLLNVDALDLTQDNFSLVSENFGISRNGIVAKQSVLSNGDIQLEIRLWGGQPTADVVVSVYDKIRASTLVQALTFTPLDWRETKTVVFSSENSAALDLVRDLTFSLTSGDVDYSGKSLVAGVIGENLVAERPRLIAPELSIFASDQTLSVALTPSHISAFESKIPLTLIANTAGLPSINASLTWSNGSPKVTMVNPNTWVGDETFVAYGTLGGQDIAIPITLRNNGTNALTVVAPTRFTEGHSGVQKLEVTLRLDQPAGEKLEFDWFIGGSI
ncbi:MAG: hypothetical protein EAZ74_07085, partial [Alphaproteobacteria bacterium]